MNEEKYETFKQMKTQIRDFLNEAKRSVKEKNCKIN